MSRKQSCPVCDNVLGDNHDFKPGNSVYCPLCQAKLSVISIHKGKVVFEHLLLLDEDWRQEENNFQFLFDEERINGMELSAQC